MLKSSDALTQVCWESSYQQLLETNHQDRNMPKHNFVCKEEPIAPVVICLEQLLHW